MSRELVTRSILPVLVADQRCGKSGGTERRTILRALGRGR